MHSEYAGPVQKPEALCLSLGPVLRPLSFRRVASRGSRTPLEVTRLEEMGMCQNRGPPKKQQQHTVGHRCKSPCVAPCGVMSHWFHRGQYAHNNQPTHHLPYLPPGPTSSTCMVSQTTPLLGPGADGIGPLNRFGQRP